MSVFQLFTCESNGTCVPDANGTLSEYACSRGCESDEEALAYWDMASEVVDAMLDNMTPTTVKKKSKKGFTNHGIYEITFRTKKATDPPVTLRMFAATLSTNDHTFALQFFRSGNKEETLRSFCVDLSTPGKVHLESENYFVHTAYDVAKDKVAADNYLYLADFIALGFCKQGDALTIALSDEWATKKTVFDGKERFPVHLKSYWLLLGRGYTYYENRGYIEYAEKNSFRIKEDVVKRMGEFPCNDDYTLAEAAAQLVGAGDDERAFSAAFVRVFANTDEVNVRTVDIAYREYNAFRYELEAHPIYATYAQQKRYVKSVARVEVGTIRHLVYFRDVELFTI